MRLRHSDSQTTGKVHDYPNLTAFMSIRYAKYHKTFADLFDT